MAKKKTESTTKKKRSASAIGRQNRARGGAYERWVAKQMQEVFLHARRGVGQARTGGDVPDVEGCGVFWTQTKSVKHPNLFDALDQADAELVTRHAQKHAPCAYTTPLVVARRTAKSGDIVGMRLAHWIKLVSDLHLHKSRSNVLEEFAVDQEKLIASLRAQLESAKQGAYVLADTLVKGSS